jgi:glycolate oxidase
MGLAQQQLMAELEDRLGAGRLLCEEEDRRKYGRDETEDLQFDPDLVVLPSSTAEVAAVLELAARERIPVTPRGAGTGLSGGALPVRGGWVLSVERLNRIRRLDRENLVVEAEAGVVLGDLQRRLADEGLFYPPDPASRDSCLLGGTIAENSAGPRSCKYGPTRKWVLGLEAVLADGRIFRTGGDSRKNVAGYDLTQLLIGSEGTLAVVTAATLALRSQPTVRVSVALPFPDLAEAAGAVSRIFRLGFEPAACELLERRAIELVARHLDVPAQLSSCEASLFLELDGNDRDELLEAASELAEALGGSTDLEPIVALDESDQRRLWQIREGIAPAIKAHSSYKEADTVVPRSALADLIRAARRIAADEHLEAVAYGHAGDGNLHVNLLRGALAEDEWATRRARAERLLFEAVADLGGTVTGEHGIGWTQREYLPLVCGPTTLELMAAVKSAFDPAGILNPGKIFQES